MKVSCIARTSRCNLDWFAHKNLPCVSQRSMVIFMFDPFAHTHYCEQNRVFMAGNLGLNTSAWNNRIGLLVLFCWFLEPK